MGSRTISKAIANAALGGGRELVVAFLFKSGISFSRGNSGKRFLSWKVFLSGMHLKIVSGDGRRFGKIAIRLRPSPGGLPRQDCNGLGRKALAMKLDRPSPRD